MPYQIVAASDGNLWFSLETARVHRDDQPGDRCDHRVQLFQPPTTQAWAITAGPDGNVWFTDRNRGSDADYIGMINPTTDTHHRVHSPFLWSMPCSGITAGPDGNLWFTDAEYQRRSG